MQRLRRILVGALCVFGCSLGYAQEAAQAQGLPKLKLVTTERIAQLAASERLAWETYLKQSQALALAERTALAQELETAKLNTSTPAPNHIGDL